MQDNQTLTDSIRESWGGTQDIAALWNETEAAEDFKPIPAGTYVCAATGGELGEARSGTPRYRVHFEVLEGEHAGRRLAHDVWLTAKALPLAKRDLAKVGIVSADALQGPLPRPIRCRVRVALRQDDDGSTFNRIRSFEAIGGAAIPMQPATVPTATTQTAQPAQVQPAAIEPEHTGTAPTPPTTEPEQHEAEPVTEDDVAGLFDTEFTPGGEGTPDAS